MLNNTDERYAGFPLGGILRAAKKNFAPRAKFRLVGGEDVIRCTFCGDKFECPAWGKVCFCVKEGITLQHILIIANHHRTHESDFRVTEKWCPVLTMTHHDYIANHQERCK